MSTSIERLRSNHHTWRDSIDRCNEAANEIERLTAEIARLTSELGTCGNGAGCLHKDALIKSLTAGNEALKRGIECYSIELADDVVQIERLTAERDALKADAARYQWLRSQHWSDNTIAAVRHPNDAIKLGHDSPSKERLDELIDAAIQGAKP